MAEVTFEERCKAKGAGHHCLGRRKRTITSIHVAEMNLAFIGDGRPAEERVVLVKERDAYAPISQCEGDTAALQSAAQDSHAHDDGLADKMASPAKLLAGLIFPHAVCGQHQRFHVCGVRSTGLPITSSGHLPLVIVQLLLCLIIMMERQGSALLALAAQIMP
jgi:hypothetical protein